MIKTKSLKEPTEASDGFRILIARGRPMYLPKSEENWHEWWKQLAPSKDLYQAYIKHKTIDWNTYKGRFIKEMLAVESQHAIKELAELNKSRDITLLCHCQVSEPNLYCHRYLVKELVEK